jgi:siderophore synthetase component
MSLFTAANPSYQTMNDYETASLEFLKTHHPLLVPAFLEMLPKGRKGILRRFAASLLREDVFGLFSGSSEVPHEMMAKWKSGKQDVIHQKYELGQQACLLFPVSSVYGFRRVEIQGDVLYINKGHVSTVETAARLMDILAAHVNETGDASWDNLRNELENGSANLALAYTFYEQDAKKQRKEAQALNAHTALEYAAVKKSGAFSPSMFFEQMSVEGHNLHPGAKTKMGMKPADVIRYAPEFHGTFSLRFAAIHKAYAQWNEAEEQLLVNAYPALKLEMNRRLEELGLDGTDYVAVPVHPWQMDYEIERIYHEEIGSNIVVPIPSFSVLCRATSSFRTVAPSEASAPVSFKTAVNSQMTSTVRSISAQTAMNAVHFTKMIQCVLKRETALEGTFVPVCEVAGYHFRSESEEKSRNLTAVLRENMDDLLTGDELAIIGSSLYACSPVTEEPIIAELVGQYAKTKGEASLTRAALLFLREYGELVLPGFLTLMVKYGVGLEGHLQNSIPVFEKGVPKRFLFRDWGGARIYGERLKAQGIIPGFIPGSVTITNSIDEMHNKVYYTVFQNHLGEIISQLCKLYALEEAACWKEIKVICDRLFQQLKAEVPKEWAELDRRKLYAPTVDHKALTLMRMMPKQGYRYVSVPNPLYMADSQRG